jgi:hypothetical protein
MSESFWGSFVISAGVIIIALIFFMQKVTNSSEQTYTLLKETTEAAMMDAVDYNAYYNETDNGQKVIRINREAFVESFVRRFSQNAPLSNTYVVEFYDINEYPPKVSIRLKTKEGGTVGDKEYTFNIVDKIDAILESVEK